MLNCHANFHVSILRVINPAFVSKDHVHKSSELAHSLMARTTQLQYTVRDKMLKTHCEIVCNNMTNVEVLYIMF